MLKGVSKLNIVRIGSYITYSSLKYIGAGILESFGGMIDEVELSHHNSPVVESIDALLLTMILDKPAPDSLMPAWRGVLSREDALHIVAYMKSLWTPHIRANCQGAKHMNCMSHQ